MWSLLTLKFIIFSMKKGCIIYSLSYYWFFSKFSGNCTFSLYNALSCCSSPVCLRVKAGVFGLVSYSKHPVSWFSNNFRLPRFFFLFFFLRHFVPVSSHRLRDFYFPVEETNKLKSIAKCKQYPVTPVLLSVRNNVRDIIWNFAKAPATITCRLIYF